MQQPRELEKPEYEKPVIVEFGSIRDHTFVNPGGNVKLNGFNFDAHTELGS